MDKDEIFRTLNDLIGTCQDGEAGFREAAEATRSERTRDILLEYARERGRFANELQVLAAESRGRPKKSRAMAGALDRGWPEDNEGGIVAEAERREDAALEAYRKALAQDLPPEVREVVERQYRAVAAAHERIRSLELRAHGGRMPEEGRDY